MFVDFRVFFVFVFVLQLSWRCTKFKKGNIEKRLRKREQGKELGLCLIKIHPLNAKKIL